MDLGPIAKALFIGHTFFDAQILLGNCYRAMGKTIFIQPFKKIASYCLFVQLQLHSQPFHSAQTLQMLIRVQLLHASLLCTLWRKLLHILNRGPLRPLPFFVYFMMKKNLKFLNYGQNAFLIRSRLLNMSLSSVASLQVSISLYWHK